MQQEKPKTSFLSALLKFALPLLVGVAFLLYIYRDIEMSTIIDQLLTKTKVGYILLSFPIVLVGNFIRSYRWRLFITPLGYYPSIKLLTLSIFGNYGVNLLLPRMGEIWRSGVVSKYTPMPFSKNLGTLIADRIYDTITVGLMTLLSVAITPVFYLDLWRDKLHFDPMERLMSLTTLLYLAGGGAVFLLLLYLLRHTKLVQKGGGFLLNLWEGLKTLWGMESRWRFIGYTLAIWGSYYLYFYVTFFAFDFTAHIGPALGLALFAISSISVIAPVQGGIGAWHFAVIVGLTSLGVAETDAAAFALIVHTVQTLWIALVGFLAVFFLSLTYNTSKQDENQTPAGT